MVLALMSHFIKEIQGIPINHLTILIKNSIFKLNLKNWIIG